MCAMLTPCIFFDPIQILDVKKAVEAGYKHPVDWQRLIFSGKVLEDEKTVAEYNLQADKMVILYIKVRCTGRAGLFELGSAFRSSSLSPLAPLRLHAGS